MYLVNWASFSWDAFATLVTGLAAIIGAVIIGLRQSRIMDKQAQIQADATDAERELRNLELRCSVLDRRIDCIQQIRDCRLSYVGAGTLDMAQKVKFYEAVQLAEFLFPVSAVNCLRQVLNDIELADSARRIGLGHRTRDDQQGVDKAWEVEERHERAVWDALPTLEHQMVDATKISI